jgi:hypothetical protein
MENKLTYKYFSGENPTNRLFNFVELLSKVTSTLSLISLDKENWTNSDAKPILRKYELIDMYNQNDKLFNDYIKLARNARSDDGVVLDIIQQVVEMVDNQIV